MLLAKVRGFKVQWPAAVWRATLCMRKDMEQLLETFKTGDALYIQTQRLCSAACTCLFLLGWILAIPNTTKPNVEALVCLGRARADALLRGAHAHVAARGGSGTGPLRRGAESAAARLGPRQPEVRSPV